MTLGELLRAPGMSVAEMPGTAGAALAATVSGIEYDSRRVGPGAVFVALRGLKHDGASFARDAARRGAVATVGEGPAPSGLESAWIEVPDARSALAALAAAYFGHPSERLRLVGVTGTNGKTTTTYLVAAIFEAAGVRCGRVGTIGYAIGTDERPLARTTPEAPDLQRLLREMADRGCGACAIEVSSHALALKRVDALRFAAAVFTNLTRDHLDFHGDMESYFAAKRSLFERLDPGAVSAVNLDDPKGAALLAVRPDAVTYAIHRAADVVPGPLEQSLSGLSFEVQMRGGTLRLQSPLVGHFNVYNILAAVAVTSALDVPADAIQRGVASLGSVPGRFQIVSRPDDEITVVVDYAHTDDALKHLLETARPLARRRLVTVFGCGGDRDRTKRPLMGAVAARLSDVVVITSDNPRSEDPERIIDEVKRGVEPPAGAPAPRNGRPAPKRNGGPECLAVVDRRAAIERAVREAGAGDLIVIAGKGHEKYQEIGGRVLKFDDVEVAREALGRRRRPGPPS